MFKLVDVYVVEEKVNGAYPACEHCGHDIRNVFVIEDESRKQMKVGSDCVVLLTARTSVHTDATRWQKRIERASAQWRESKKKTNYPQPLPDETREQYINRRVSEMANALKAGKAWTAHYNAKFQPKGHIGYGWSATWGMRVVDRAKRMGIKIDTAMIVKRHSDRHAKRWNANPYDFRRPIWELAKI